MEEKRYISIFIVFRANTQNITNTSSFSGAQDDDSPLEFVDVKSMVASSSASKPSSTNIAQCVNSEVNEESSCEDFHPESEKASSSADSTQSLDFEDADAEGVLRKCIFCSEKFQNKSDLFAHKCGTGCHICGKSLGLYLSLVRHVLEHPGMMTFTCWVCNYKVSNRSEFQVHMGTHPEISKRYYCVICGKKFNMMYQLTSHVVFTHYCKGTKIEDLENLGAPKSIQISEQMKQDDSNRVTSKQSKAESSSQDVGKDSSVEVHRVDQNSASGISNSSEIPALDCKICGALFNEGNGLVEHMLTHYEHSENVELPADSVVKKEP